MVNTPIMRMLHTTSIPVIDAIANAGRNRITLMRLPTWVAMHMALASNLTPYRAAAHSLVSAPLPALAGLNEMITGQAAFIAVLDQFKILMVVMLVVSPLVIFLRKPVSTH